MRFLLLHICLFFSFSLSAQEANWLTSFEAAKVASKAEGKYILINFSGSDWCVPCAKLERDLFSTTEFASFATENLVLLKADFPVRKKNLLSEEQRQHNDALAEIYNPKGSFPTMVLIDHLGKIIGYITNPKSSTDAYINSIKDLALPKPIEY